MGRYDNKCGSCSYSEYYKTYGNNVKVYCTYYKSYCWADESCYYYRGSFIATIVCKILGEEKHLKTLEKIKQIRRLVLDSDGDYLNVMNRYDFVAPSIAKRIEKDYQKNKNKSLAESLFNLYIKPVVDLYEKQRVFECIEKYSQMVDVLESCYNLDNRRLTNLEMVQEVNNQKIKKILKRKD